MWNDWNCENSLRFVCEKSKVPEPVNPVHLQAITALPYGGGLDDTGYVCLLSPPDDINGIMTSTQRLVQLGESDNSFTVPGVNSPDLPNSLPIVIDQTLPSTNKAVGIFKCTSTTAEGRKTSVSTTILLENRRFQPSNGRFTKTLHVGDNITLRVTNRGMFSSIRWRKFSDLTAGTLQVSDGSLTHTIMSATTDDADVYGTHVRTALDDHRYSLIRVIVNACPPGRWDPPTCLGVCDNCYNGGVCHQESGTCICPPGFMGENCLTACGENRYGWECELECGPGKVPSLCEGSQFCLPDAFGCNCLSGYTGIYCNETCPAEKFGVDCAQDCHCSQGSSCNPFTGQCLEDDCEDGWWGPGCQVPSVCPVGYFGVNCAEKCNCLGNGACGKSTGYCTESQGTCAAGYTTDVVLLTDNCKLFSGCFAACSKTCHCFGGAVDCNSVTGSCMSSMCHPRWMGYNCQTDRFETSTIETNPGRALFSCSVTADIVSGPFRSEDIKIAVGDVTTWRRDISYNDTSISGRTRNNSFIVEDLSDGDVIYCFVGELSSTSSFAYIRVRRSHYVLPVLSLQPTVLEVGLDYVIIRWAQWNESTDLGEGPIIGYKVYYRLPGEDWLGAGYDETNAAPDSDPLEYNVTGLMPGTEYMLTVTTIRDGIGGEGAHGPEVTAVTLLTPTTSEITGPVDRLGLGIGIGLGVFIVAGVGIAAIVFVMRRRKSSTSDTTRHTQDSKANEVALLRLRESNIQ